VIGHEHRVSRGVDPVGLTLGVRTPQQERLGRGIGAAARDQPVRQHLPPPPGVAVGLTIFDIDLGDGSTIDWAVDRSQKSDGGALVALSSIPGSFPFKKLQASGISLVHKNDSEAELVEVLRQALGGSVILSRRIMNLLSSAGRDPHSPIKLLGSREQQVLGLLGQRLSNEEIAELLGCAPSTVADHRKRIMRKLDLHRIEEVIDYAIRHGMVHDSMASGARSGIKR
jgi:DNA-binding NarL/FixJ family response regulator